MLCVNGHENPAGTKFCGECGAPLAATCSNCGASNPPGNKFCGTCGTPLGGQAPTAATPKAPEAQPARAPARAERRVVSVLFADLVGFTTYSESRDPEDVRAMLTRYFDRSQEILTRFRGTVDKFIGDAVMAWWGAIEAREDDAERAVRAALELVEMVQALGAEIGLPDLALRAGVLTGETSVGPGGNEKGLIVGDLVNTASRLQSIADGGTVVVGESTANLVASSIELQPLGEQLLKGKEIPVKAFRAVRVVAQRGGRGKAEGLEPPFTGRHDELRLLKDQLHAAGREQRARLVSIVGEGGIGKSRLAWELAKYIDGIKDTIYWHQGRSPAYGDGIALWSLGEMIRGRAGIVSEGDDRAKGRMKLRTAIAEYVPLEDERRWVEPRLAALLGVDEAPPGDRAELFAAIRTFFQRIAERGTAVLVFEDLQWADDGVLEFIEDLIERSTRHKILVITLSRPELLDRHPTWGSGRRNTLAVHLAPLADDEMAALVTGMAPGIPDEAVASIVDRAGGIPLYAVEFVRMLLTAGDLVRDGDRFTLSGPLEDLAVPDSLAAVIGARLDRLSPEDKELVQDAAVLGQSFTLRGLAAVRGVEAGTLEGPLRELVRHEMFEFEEDPRSAERGQYRFVQGLIREVAYGRLSLGDRHVRHRRVAEYFAGLGEPELAGIVASHFLAAHETAPPGSENLLEKGRTSLLDAARRAGSLQSHAQALVLYRQALALTASPVERAATLLDAAESAGWAGEVDEALRMGREGADLAGQHGEDDLELRGHTLIAWTFNSFYRADEAVAHLTPVFERITDFDTPARVAAGLEMSRALMLNLRASEAVTVAERVLPVAERLATPAQVVDGIITKATALGTLGRYLEAEATLNGLVGLADRLGLQAQATRAINNLGSVMLNVDPLAALQSSEALHERALTFAGTSWFNRVRMDFADAAVSLGRFDEAQEVLDSLDLDRFTPIMQASVRITGLRVQAMRDPASNAGRAMLDDVESWDELGDPQMEEWARELRSEGRRWVGDLEGAYDMAIAMATPGGVAWAMVDGMGLGDVDRTRRALERFRELIGGRSRLADAVERFGAGCVRILEGDRDGGIPEAVAGLDALAKVLPPVQFTVWQTNFAGLVGLDHPAAMSAAQAADEYLRSIGAEGLRRHLAPGLPADPEEARRVG